MCGPFVFPIGRRLRVRISTAPTVYFKSNAKNRKVLPQYPMNDLPERLQHMESERRVLIDDTERPMQRPQKPVCQKHTVEKAFILSTTRKSPRPISVP